MRFKLNFAFFALAALSLSAATIQEREPLRSWRVKATSRIWKLKA